MVQASSTGGGKRTARNPSPSALSRALAAYQQLNLHHSTTDNTGRTERTAPSRALQLTPPQIERLAAGYRGGATVYELAVEFGIHRRTVSKHLKAAGVQMRNTPLSDLEIARAIALYNGGLSVTSVGQVLGRDHAGIWKALRKAGVAMRDSHGRERTSH